MQTTAKCSAENATDEKVLSNPQNEVGDGMLLTARRAISEEAEGRSDDSRGKSGESPSAKPTFLTKKEIPTQWKLHRDVF